MQRHSQNHSRGHEISQYVPASLALVSKTVWNHVGKLYMTVKLHVATKKLLMPTSTGIFCFRSEGARTGSTAIRSSKITKAMKNTAERIIGTKTGGDDH